LASDVIDDGTNINCVGAWMFNSVLVEVFANLTSDIRTKISRLGEDTTTDSGKYAYN
jgi:hypothetical protein